MPHQRVWTQQTRSRCSSNCEMLVESVNARMITRSAKSYFEPDELFSPALFGKGTDSPSTAPCPSYQGERAVMRACPNTLVIRTAVVYGPEACGGKNFVYQVSVGASECRRRLVI